MPDPHATNGRHTDPARAQSHAAAGTPYQKPTHVTIGHRACPRFDTIPPDQVRTLHPRILQQAADTQDAPQTRLPKINETLNVLTSAPHPLSGTDAPRPAPCASNRRAAP